MHPSSSSVAGAKLLKTSQNWSGNTVHATMVTTPQCGRAPNTLDPNTLERSHADASASSFLDSAPG